MPFRELESFSMPLVGGGVVLPEVLEVKKQVNGADVVEVSIALVDQCHKDLPEGVDQKQYSPSALLKVGAPIKRISTIMLYPKSVNPYISLDKKSDDKSGETQNQEQNQTQTQTQEQNQTQLEGEN